MAIASLLAGMRRLRANFSPYRRGALGRGVQHAVDMAPPPCGGEAGLQPNDTAVVEFSIARDGRDRGLAPIYASRNGPVAVAFARAVAGWSWKPEDVAKIKPFFRAATRVQLRCSTGERAAQRRGADAPGIGQVARGAGRKQRGAGPERRGSGCSATCGACPAGSDGGHHVGGTRPGAGRSGVQFDNLS
jgi:hypothetical protein